MNDIKTILNYLPSKETQDKNEMEFKNRMFDMVSSRIYEDDGIILVYPDAKLNPIECLWVCTHLTFIKMKIYEQVESRLSWIESSEYMEKIRAIQDEE